MTRPAPVWQQQPRQQHRETEQMARMTAETRRRPSSMRTVELTRFHDLTVDELDEFVKACREAKMSGNASVTITSNPPDRPHESTTYSLTCRTRS